MVINYTFDNRDENGPELQIEVEIVAGYAGTLEYPAVDAEIVIVDIKDADGNSYENEYFTRNEWANIEYAAETALEAN